MFCAVPHNILESISRHRKVTEKKLLIKSIYERAQYIYNSSAVKKTHKQMWFHSLYTKIWFVPQFGGEMRIKWQTMRLFSIKMDGWWLFPSFSIFSFASAFPVCWRSICQRTNRDSVVNAWHGNLCKFHRSQVDINQNKILLQAYREAFILFYLYGFISVCFQLSV